MSVLSTFKHTTPDFAYDCQAVNRTVNIDMFCCDDF